MKKILTIALCSLFLFACDKKEQNNSVDDSFTKILDKKEFVMGLDDSFPPMGFRNKSNEIVGFDIDLAKEVTKRLNISLKLQPISWDAKEQELNTGKIDCIWNGLSVDSSRIKAFNLSKPYLKNRMVFVVKNKSLTMESLNTKKIAVQNGSTAQKILEASEYGKAAAEIIPFDDNLTAMLDLEHGGVDFVFLDEVVAEYLIQSGNKPFVIMEEGLNEEEYAIGFRKKDEALKNAIDSILTLMKNDGSFATISEKWFGK